MGHTHPDLFEEDENTTKTQKAQGTKKAIPHCGMAFEDRNVDAGRTT
jgi:hypothetical protein